MSFSISLIFYSKRLEPLTAHGAAVEDMAFLGLLFFGFDLKVSLFKSFVRALNLILAVAAMRSRADRVDLFIGEEVVLPQLDRCILRLVLHLSRLEEATLLEVDIVEEH